MSDVLEAAVGLAGDATDLGMHLVVPEAIDDMTPSLFEALGPFDVVGFIETGAQFEERGDLLAHLRCCDERFRKVGLAGQPVQRDLDGDHRRIIGSLAQELHEGIHGLVGIAHEHFALAHLLDDGLLALKHGRPLGRKGNVGEPLAHGSRNAGWQ